ncbi:MAG: hypothetical protein N2651_08015 [Fimbriimonadales bacterium]|nr:hypothetical protein [Fimbriimonadales bacterium]
MKMEPATQLQTLEDITKQGNNHAPVIITGWDSPDTRMFRRDYARFNSLPFNGTAIKVRVDADILFPFQGAFSARPWNIDWFREPIRELQAVARDRSRQLQYNLLLVNANPGDVDWFDDGAWREVEKHLEIAADVARQGELKGIIFDPEPYNPPHAQFEYGNHPSSATRTYTETQRKARERGRQVWRAFFRRFPEATVLFYFALSGVERVRVGSRAVRTVQGHWYDLLPSFLDGCLDVAPAEALLIDGNEDAYRYNSRAEYTNAANRIRTENLFLISPENRKKYQERFRVGQAFYLDAYINPPGDDYYIDGLGRHRAERLEENLRDALETADGAIWIYGESHRWWREGGPATARYWDEAFPGCLEAIRRAVEPERALGEALRLLPNRVFNGGCLNTNGWSQWQRDDSRGTFVWDENGYRDTGSLKAIGVRSGCWYQEVAVSPLSTVGFRAWRKIAGQADAYVYLRWKTSDGRWTAEKQDKGFTTEKSTMWQPILGLARVPETAERCVILLYTTSRGVEADQTWFDAIEMVQFRDYP